jgi:hypothetical protein
MKKILFYCISFLLLGISCHKEDTTPVPTQKSGCTDPAATNYDPAAVINCCCAYPKKGALLFWTNDPNVISTCGVITVRLSNGQESTINGYYFVAPANCVNSFGGYFYVDEGTYTYELHTQNPACNLIGGTVTVVGNSCNKRNIF